MAEAAVAQPAEAPDLQLSGPVRPAIRGTLHIEPKVNVKIARQAAVEVPGVVPYSVTLGSLTGRNLPRALSDSSTRHPAIAIEIAVSWPASAAEVSAHVQEHVADALTRFTGRRPSRVDVDVVSVAQSEGLLLSEEIATIVATQQDSDDEVDKNGGRPPRAYPGAGRVAPLIGVLLIVAAILAGREFAVAQGYYDADAWIAEATQTIASTAWQTWMVAVAIAAVVVGSWLLYLAIRPRKRTHRALAVPGLWTRDVDIARRISAIALDDDNTVSATTTVARGRAKIAVHGREGSDSAPLRERLDVALARLETAPRVVLDYRAAPATDPLKVTADQGEQG